MFSKTKKVSNKVKDTTHLVSDKLKNPLTHETQIINKMQTRNKKCVEFFHGKYIYEQDGSYKPGIEKKLFKDGSIYYGHIGGNKRSGKGLLEYKNGDVYIGDWLEDKVHGRGMYIFKNGERYEGEV